MVVECETSKTIFYVACISCCKNKCILEVLRNCTKYFLVLFKYKGDRLVLVTLGKYHSITGCTRFMYEATVWYTLADAIVTL